MADLDKKHFCIRKISAFIKSLFDMVLASIAILVFSVPMVIIALIIKFTSKGPVLFRQKRIGKNGKEFEIYKFRTMVQGAEDYKKFLTPDQAETYIRNNFKLINDPRITPVGKFLRKSSLDELPQLFNVIIRNMSLVGPRPVTKAELPKFKENLNKVLSVKPGITGLAQVNDMNKIPFEQRMSMDIHYVDNFSILLDLSIILKTVGIVFGMKGM